MFPLAPGLFLPAATNLPAATPSPYFPSASHLAAAATLPDATNQAAATHLPSATHLAATTLPAATYFSAATNQAAATHLPSAAHLPAAIHLPAAFEARVVGFRGTATVALHRMARFLLGCACPRFLLADILFLAVAAAQISSTAFLRLIQYVFSLSSCVPCPFSVFSKRPSFWRSHLEYLNRTGGWFPP